MIKLLVIALCMGSVLASSFASEDSQIRNWGLEHSSYRDFDTKYHEAKSAVNRYINEASQGVYHDFLYSFSECNIKRCSHMLINKYNDFISDQRRVCLELMAPSICLIYQYEGQNLGKKERKELQEKVLNLYENREEVRVSSFSDPELVVMFYLYLCLSTDYGMQSYLSYFFSEKLNSICMETGYEQHKVVRNRTIDCSLYGDYGEYFPNLYK